MSKQVDIACFALGGWQTNCYVVSVEGHGGCWIVDAGYEPLQMIDAIRQRGLTPEAVLLTHAHLDHIGGLADVRAVWPEVPIHIHQAERTYLTDPVNNLSVMVPPEITGPEADGVIEPGEPLELGGEVFEVRHTPGHSPGGVTLLHAASEQAIVGDTLFAEGVGRFDFPHSDGPTLLRSIREQLLTLNDAMRVYPGHGAATTIGHERTTNMYLQPGGASIFEQSFDQRFEP